jgi:hypothetical protein
MGGGRSFSAGRSAGASRSFSNRSVGNRSFGNRSVGSRNVGSRNVGSRNVGNRNLSNRNLGNRNLGNRNLGNRNLGNRNLGNRNLSNRNLSNRNLSNRNLSNRNLGNRNLGTTGTRNTKLGTGVGPGGRIGTGPGGRIGAGPGGRIGAGPGGRIGGGPGSHVMSGHGPGHIGPGHGPGSRPDFARIHDRHIHVFRERRHIWIGGIMRTIVPIAALTGLYLGADYFEPDGYVAVARPACGGLTEDGCSLRWQEVPLEGGGVDMQCVQFCRRVGVVAVPPPVPTAVLNVPPPVAAAPVAVAAVPAAGVAAAPATGSCELTIFSQASFGGMSAPTSEDQPRLGDVGWKNEVASVQVKSGTWDFYAEDDFAGEAMRLPPGTYADLGQWTRKVSSFMCSQP